MYKRQGLIRAAREAGDTRMSMLLQTVGSTGIRISELKYISVESLETGRAEIYNKGKSRVVLLPGKLVDMLRLSLIHIYLSYPDGCAALIDTYYI